MGVLSFEDMLYNGGDKRKVKQFHANNEEELENLINDFLENYQLIHIDWYLNGETKRATIVYK